ncbi:uncharacterized protein AUP68_02906 [Ilyonectria robusta]
MPDRGTFRVPPSSDLYPSRDKSFRQDFATPLAKNNSQLSYAGYRRGLELYGNENVLCAASKAHHFRRWMRNNQEVHASYRSRAKHEGLNPDQGFVEVIDDEAFYHYYNPNDRRNTSSAVANTYPTEPEELPPATPRHNPPSLTRRPSITQYPRRPISAITIDDSDEDTMPSTRPNRNRRGQFTADLPEALTRMDGLRAPDKNDFAGTCVGNAELCSIFAELLDRQYNAQSDEEVKAV